METTNKDMEKLTLNESAPVNAIVPKLSDKAVPVLGYANTYFFAGGRYFFDNDLFYIHVKEGFKVLPLYSSYPYSYLYPIGAKDAVAVSLATFKFQNGIN